MSSTLILFGVAVFLLWIKFLWSRRRFYLFSWKHPGPIGWPIIGCALKFGNIETLLYELADVTVKYKTDTGFAWVGPFPFVYTKDPVVVEKLLTSQDCLDRTCIYDAFVESLGAGLLTISTPKCTTHRKMLNPAFSHNILKGFSSIFNEGADTIVQNLEKFVGTGEGDLLPSIFDGTLRISIQTLCGLDRDDCHEKSMKLLPCIPIVLTTTMQRLVKPWLRIEALFKLTSMYKPYMEAKTFIDGFVEEVATKKLVAIQKERQNIKINEDVKTEIIRDENDNVDIKKDNKIFMDRAVELYLNNQFDWTDFIGESSTIIYAAFETTGTTIQSVLMMLAMHPQYQEKLYEELEYIFPNKDCNISDDDLSRLVYLEMVINETLRIISTTPIIARQTSADVYISEDMTIPKGTQIVFDMFNMHKNKRIWGPNADVFNPDTFLPSNMANIHPYAFIPFSKGPRICIGWRYANMVVKVVLAKILRNYRVTTKFKFEDLRYIANITLKFKTTPELEVHRR